MQSSRRCGKNLKEGRNVNEGSWVGEGVEIKRSKLLWDLSPDADSLKRSFAWMTGQH